MSTFAQINQAAADLTGLLRQQAATIANAGADVTTGNVGAIVAVQGVIDALETTVSTFN